MTSEQAAEHIAANALYQIEVNHVESVEFDGKMVRDLLGEGLEDSTKSRGRFSSTLL